MSNVPSNLIPTRITQLPEAPVASEDSLLLIVYGGVSYKIRAGDLLSVAGVPTTRQIIAGTGLTGGGQLSSNVTLSIASGGVGHTQLATTGVTAGIYGSATVIPVLTIDDTGRVTAASTITPSISNLAGGAAYSIPFQTAPNVTGFIPPPSGSNKVLEWNGSSFFWNDAVVGTVSAVTASLPISSSGGATPNLSIPPATGSVNGYLSSSDWSTFNNKQNGIILTTIGFSGPATFDGTTLNVPNYNPGVPFVYDVTASLPLVSSGGATPNISIFVADALEDGYLTSTDWNTFNDKQPALVSGTNIKTINGASLLGPGDLGVGTVTYVGALSIDAFGNDITSSVADATTTPVITLSIPTASSVNRGALSSSDWTTFNDKVTSVSGTAGNITSTGGTTPVIDLATSGVTPNTYGSSTDIPVLTIDTYGRVTVASTASNPQGTVTSVGLSMPSAFSVSGTPVTSSGTLAVTANGVSTQYIRGDGQLADFPSNPASGGAVNFYLNGGTAASVAGYYQMSTSAVINTGVDFTASVDGYISQWLTNVGSPNQVQIPAGNWNFQIYMSSSSTGGSPSFYLEILKYDGTTFTAIANSSANPEYITGGTSVDLYYTSVAVPQTTLLSTDLIAVRVYVNVSGRTITMHTQDSHLCQVVTNFPSGIAALNGLTANIQYLAVGTAGTDFAISSSSDTHTFNLPTASASNRGALSSADWTTFNNKAPATTGTSLLYGNGSGGFSNATVGTGLTFSAGTLAVGVIDAGTF